MKIEFCCKINPPLINVCHYNIKIDGKKHYIVDDGCDLKIENIKKLVKDRLMAVNDGWLYECDDDAECRTL